MKIEKLKKDVAGVPTTIYPVTIPQAVIDPTSGNSVRAELDEVDDNLAQLAGEVNLLDAVQGARIKDIENVLSTANLNQSAQLSVSGRKTIPLPKNAANGGMQVKLEGLTAENLVVNGSFENALSGWINLINAAISQEQSRFGNSSLRFYYTGTNPTTQYSYFEKPTNIGNKYYVSGWSYNINSLNNILIRISDGGGFLNATSLPFDAAKLNQWQKVSGIVTANSASTRFTVGSTHTAASAFRFYYDGLLFINLTQIFGSGNEPDLATCDAMFSSYFEGKKNFEPTGRIRSVDKLGNNSTNLYLTAPELRSNGLIKDEIRKGANGYELVKRVGVGTSNGEIVTAGDFSDPTKWTVVGGTSIISNGTLKIIADAGIASNATQNKTITAGKIYRYKIDVLSTTGAVYLYIGSTAARSISLADSGKTISGFFLSSTGGTIIRLIKDLGSNISAEFDNISVFEYNTTEGVAIAGGEAVYGGNIHYTLATPEITPISHGGILNSAENGTVYHEPVIADAGVYGTNMPILLTDYPIASIEEIIKHENGIDTYLNVATAVVASDGLSFTHPDLTSGDLVLFTYAFDKESTNGNITATFYDSNVVKIDTVTGKAYRINEVVTNGVLTRTLTEV